MSLAAKILSAARMRGVVISTAESCTGGLIIAALTEIPGSSDVVDSGFITYSNSAKQQMLGVSAQTLAEYGAVSEQVAAEMAFGALIKSEASLTVAVTGIAGPGGSEYKPEGRVCFAIANALDAATETVDFGALGREQVRAKTVKHALEKMLVRLTKLNS